MIYKIIIYKVLNPIPEVFKINSSVEYNKFRETITEQMADGVIGFVDINNISRIYDLSCVTKLYIKQIQ